MSSTDSNKGSTFNSAAVNNINSDNIGQPTSASIIASMSKISGCDIKSASLVVDGFWDYIENRNEHWRKDTNTLTIPNFGTFTIKPFYNGKIKKKKIGIIKFIGSEFIYRNKKGQWNKPQIQKLQISFSLSPKVELNKDRKGFGAMRSESHSKWTAHWKGKGLTHLSVKRKICVYIHEKFNVPLIDVNTLLTCLFEVTLSSISSQKRAIFVRRGTFTFNKKVSFRPYKQFTKRLFNN